MEKSHNENANIFTYLDMASGKACTVNSQHGCTDGIWFICPEAHFRNPFKWSCYTGPLCTGS